MEETHAELLTQFKDNKTYVRFIKDMQEAGVPVRTYAGRGRYGKECPAVRTSDEFDEQTIMCATKVKLCRDNLGRRYILYP